MKTFTVQCARAAYRSNTVTIEANTLAEALEKAIATADGSPAWSDTDTTCPTFVEAVAEGHDVDFWFDEQVDQLAIPSGFTESGAGPHIVITVAGGLIHDVDIRGGTALVEVHDYDTEGTTEPENLTCDPDGRRYLRGLWSNRIDDPITGEPSSDDAG